MTRAGILTALFLAVPALAARAQTSMVPRPLSLEEALQLAVPASEALGLARSAMVRARGEQLRARSEFFPQLTGSASYSRLIKSQYSGLATSDTTGSAAPTSCDRFIPVPTQPIGARVDSLEKALECASGANPFSSLGNLPFGRANTYNLGLSLSQTLFSGGRVQGQVQAANAGKASAEIGFSASEAQLILDVVQTYFDAVLADQLMVIARIAVDQADSTLRETELRRSLGTVPEFDLLRARVTRDNQRALVIQRTADRELAYLRLGQQLEIPGNQPLRLVTALDDSSVSGAPSLRPYLVSEGDTVALNRAAVKQSALSVKAEEGLYRAAKSQNLPAVTLSSAYGRVAYPASGLPSWNQFLTNWSMAVALQLPLFTGGRIQGDKLVAHANLDDARLRLRQTTEFAELDARSSLTQLRSAQEFLRASQGTTEQAVRAYDIAEIRFKEGISTHTELLDARLALEQARANHALASRDAQIARVRLALLARLPLATGTTAPVSSRSTPQRPTAQATSSAPTGTVIP